ncbi:Presilphiperfolan-8-beta-ol synthase [Xylaria digitata]|nr:Presilphiperfolan-8-beta-ol synthase [Xylaria digitata]
MTSNVTMQITTEIPLAPTGYSSPTQLDDAQSTLQSRAPEPVEEPEPRRSVRVPDLFSSIMASRPTVNPNYFKVKAEGDGWIAKIMSFDKTSAKNIRVDFCFLSSIWVPNADEEALRMTLDWNHWIFHFDDQFDEGHLKDNPIAAREEIDRTMAIMEKGTTLYTPEQNPIRYVFQTCWQQLVKRASPVAQVERSTRGDALKVDIDTYIDIRRGNIGVYPAIAVAEYGHGIRLPESIFQHPALQECMRVSSDLVFMTNDVVSYRKDLESGVHYNLITILSEQGMSIQQSVDKIGTLIDTCYQRWYTALATLPPYGEEIDGQVLMFVDICRFIALGNLHWSFKTGRYHGPEGYDIYRTRIMHLPS